MAGSTAARRPAAPRASPATAQASPLGPGAAPSLGRAPPATGCGLDRASSTFADFHMDSAPNFRQSLLSRRRRTFVLLPTLDTAGSNGNVPFRSVGGEQAHFTHVAPPPRPRTARGGWLQDMSGGPQTGRIGIRNFHRWFRSLRLSWITAGLGTRPGFAERDGAVWRPAEGSARGRRRASFLAKKYPSSAKV